MTSGAVLGRLDARLPGPDYCRHSRARRHPPGCCAAWPAVTALPARSNVRSPRPDPAAHGRLQAAARARDGATGCRCSSRPTRRAASSSASGTGRRPGSPGAMALGAAGDAGAGRAGRSRDRARAASARRERQLRAGARPRDRIRATPRSACGRSATTRRGRAARGRVAARPPVRRRAPATRQALPGQGRGGVDPHHALARVDRTRDELDAVELVPFRAAIGGERRTRDVRPRRRARAHRRARAAGDARAPVMHDLLRGELGFAGVSITDALDMRALPQGAAQAVDVVAALEAGVDLLLSTADRRAQRRIESALVAGCRGGALRRPTASRARGRGSMRSAAGSTASSSRSLDVVGSPAHRALARELAARALTLVRDDAGLLPLRLSPDASDPRGHARAEGPHARGHVLVRDARRWPRRSAATARRWTRSSPRIHRPTRRSRRSGDAPRATT